MSDAVYKRLAEVLDTLPNGFPATESGIELRILRKIFRPDEAELFCFMRLTFESAAQVAERTGRPLEGLEDRLISMGANGQLFAIQFGEAWFFRMLPWVFGIFEFQLGRIDRELAEMCEEYGEAFGRPFFSGKPQLMQTIPIEETLTGRQETLPFERVSALIEKNQSFLLNECICKKEHALLGKPCDRPTEVCLAMAPVAGVFDHAPHGRVITRQEAYDLLKMTEEQGLVHMTYNVQNGQFYICNCCKCCCGPLRAINELGIPAADVINSHYHAVIDPDQCTGCGLCADERCQVNAVVEEGDCFKVIKARCIGCGLCVTTCPADAIILVKKEQSEITVPPVTEAEWFELRGRIRGKDFSRYK